MLHRHYPLSLWWLCVLVASSTVLCCVAAAPAPTRPAVVRFAFMHVAYDPNFDYDAVQLFAGLKSAEKVINDANLLMGTELAIEHVFMNYSLVNTAHRTDAAQQAVDSGIMGFVASDFLSTAIAYEVSQAARLPVVASRSLLASELGNPTYPFVNSYRAPLAAQYRTMLHHARTDDRTQCSSFVLLYRTLFADMALSNFTATVATLGLQAAAISLGDIGTPLNISGTLNAFYNAFKYRPRCIFLFCLASDIVELLPAFYNDTRFLKSISFYASDFSTRAVFTHPQFGTAPFKKLFFISNFGDFTSLTDPKAVSYRSALGGWLATNPTLPTTLNASVEVETRPSMLSYEGYLAGMMIGKVLAATVNLTAGGWLASLYSQKRFWIGDTSVGPFVDHCLGDATVTTPCFCNVGGRNSFVLLVNNATGQIGSVPADAVESKFLTLPTPAGDCYPGDSALKSAFKIQLFAPLAMTAAGGRAFAYFYEVCRNMADSVNDAGTMPTTLISVAYMNTILDPLPATAVDAVDSYTKLAATQAAQAIFGSWFGASKIRGATLNFYTGPSTLAVDPGLTAATAYTRFTWFLKPTLADLTHACTMLLASLYDDRARVVAISGDLTAFTLAQSSLNTLQFPLAEGSGVVNLSDTTALTALLSAQMLAAADSDVVVFLSTVDAAGVVSALACAAAAADNVMGQSGDAAPLARFALVVATDVGYMYDGKFQLPNRTLTSLLRFPIYFATHLMPFFEPLNTARKTMMTTVNSTDPAVIETPSPYIGAVIMNVLHSALQNFDNRPTSTSVLEYLYAMGTISALGVTVGPFLTDNCSSSEVALNRPDRKCQCFKAARTLNVYDFRGWLANSASYNPKFQWAMPHCGPLYEPLAVASSLNVAMVVGIAVPCGLLLTAAVVYFSSCYGRRNNRVAPKDPNVPFALVFTDIQSSTSLWARAPEAMGPALEKHHEVLRRLLGWHGGYEVKTIGDSFMVAFKRASDAAAFALAVQTTLFEEEWPAEIDDTYIALAQEAWSERQEAESDSTDTRDLAKGAAAGARPPQWEDMTTYTRYWNGIRVRVGLHWGLGSVKFDPVSSGYDYYGTVVNTAARVEGVGNGGQVLATKDMFDQLEAEEFDLSSVLVEPLGPQPLRGLDAPVPLFQISPTTLCGRQFASLRLDVEIGVDDESSDGGGCASSVGGDASSHLSGSGADDTPELHLQRLLRRTKDAAEHREYFMRVAGFLLTALRTSALAWRKETLKHLMKKWHIRSRVPPATAKESTETTLFYDVLSLTVRVGLAAEEAQRAQNQVLRMSHDGRSNASGTRTRRQSMRRSIEGPYLPVSRSGSVSHETE